jgi:tetratricopeptide (TPR) repeat protein
MAKKVATAPTQAEAQVGEFFSRSERFIETYKNHILIGIVAVVVITLGALGIRHYYLLPMEENAKTALYPSENYFASQLWDKALNGDSITSTGFLGVIDDFGSTTSGKLARVYAGICYYQLGQYDQAIDYLKKFSASEKILTPAIASTIGDCYIGLGKTDEAIRYFRRAAEEAADPNLSPIYLKKQATALESQQNYKAALEVYTAIKNRYPSSYEAQGIDRYIERARILSQK